MSMRPRPSGSMLSASRAAACMASLFASSLLSLLLGIALRETLTAILSSCACTIKRVMAGVYVLH